MIQSKHGKSKQRASIRFGGVEDITCRSAWTSTNKSFMPPSPAQRKTSLIAKVESTIDAPPMEAMDSESSHSESNHSSDDKLTPMVMPSALKNRSKMPMVLPSALKNRFNTPIPKPSALMNRSKTVPILKMTRDEDFHIQEQLPAARSAWGENEKRNASFGPSPVRRQSTHTELDLADACAKIQRMAEDSSTSLYMSSSSCFTTSNTSSSESSKSSSKWWQV